MDDRSSSPSIGVIGGSGLYAFLEDVEHTTMTTRYVDRLRSVLRGAIERLGDVSCACANAPSDA